MKTISVNFAGTTVECCGTDDGLLLWPKEWTEEVERYGFVDAAVKILASLPPVAVKVSWIIGSASKTLSGQERSDSWSHAHHKAFDLSPMYDSHNALDPEGKIMGLAWNVVSLIMLADAYSQYPHFVVEGDHLHVLPEVELNADIMPSVWSMPTWYSWSEDIGSSEDLHDLAGSFWSFSISSGAMSIMSQEEVRSLIRLLKTIEHESAD